MNTQISFRDFCKLESISFCMSQLRGNKRYNVIPKNIESTQKNYLYRLWDFHYWLVGYEFSHDVIIPIDESTFKKYRKTVILNGLEHFLKLYEENPSNYKRDFIKLVVQYLKDPIHINKKSSTLKIDYYAIKAYFDRNEYPLNFRFNFKTRDSLSGDGTSERLLTLNGFLRILTVGQPTLIQRTVFLCKFHRGIDTSTFVDRFNFEAMEQIVNVFDTFDHDVWDLQLCPIPIKLTRLKTGVRHVGFLDVDAIKSLQCYLNYRQHKLGRKIQKNEPIFINHFKKPVTEDWMRRSFRKLIRNAGMEYLIKNSGNAPKQFDFLRILLKSTLIACDANKDISNHVIGHKTQSDLTRNTEYNIANMRLEYAKSSNTINIFEKLRKILNSVD